MHYSPSTGGFYDEPENYKNFPSDAVQVTEDKYDEVVRKRAPGKVIVPDADGQPTLVDAPAMAPITDEQVAEQRRSAFRMESDPLYMEWQYDLLPESEAKWRAKVLEIKDRFPFGSES
ncbi:MAG: hypothetical protein RR740_09130 [Pseudomonas sp.]